MIESITTIEELKGLTASDVMTTPVTTVHMWDSVHNVAKIFLENNISSAVVVDMDDIPLGVITKSDLVRYAFERETLVVTEQNKNPVRAKGESQDVVGKGFHLEPEEATIENWIMPVLLDVHPATILPAVVKKMVKNGLHHIFVTEVGEKKIKGVITTFDLLMVMQRILNPAEVVLA